jgi:hypothetical protein
MANMAEMVVREIERDSLNAAAKVGGVLLRWLEVVGMRGCGRMHGGGRGHRHRHGGTRGGGSPLEPPAACKQHSPQSRWQRRARLLHACLPSHLFQCFHRWPP